MAKKIISAVLFLCATAVMASAQTTTSESAMLRQKADGTYKVTFVLPTATSTATPTVAYIALKSDGTTVLRTVNAKVDGTQLTARFRVGRSKTLLTVGYLIPGDQAKGVAPVARGFLYTPLPTSGVVPGSSTEETTFVVDSPSPSGNGMPAAVTVMVTGSLSPLTVPDSDPSVSLFTRDFAARPRTNGSFDYDLDGVVEPWLSTLGRIGKNGEPVRAGWIGRIPDCGQEGEAYLFNAVIGRWVTAIAIQGCR